MKDYPSLDPASVLNSMSDGVYITDTERVIMYWNQGAERITGWKAGNVIGKSCKDGLLCHTDGKGRLICGKDTCPLYRSIATGKPSAVPLMVNAKRPDGERTSVQVNVAPLFDQQKNIIGGVEVFRDMSEIVKDLTKARDIQGNSLKWDFQNTDQLSAKAHYLPHDMIGGDYYAVQPLNDNQVAFLLADVMGHGTSAALLTMYLRSFWEEHFILFPDLEQFANTLNRNLYKLIAASHSFVAAVCGIIDTGEHQLTLIGGAFPPPFLINCSGETRKLDASGLAFGMLNNTQYKKREVSLASGDCLFFYTDGATEVEGKNSRQLEEEGLLNVLKNVGYPEVRFAHNQIEAEIMDYSNSVSLTDDVTFLEFRMI